MGVERALQGLQEEAPKEAGEDPDRQKEAGPTRHPVLPIRCQDRRTTPKETTQLIRELARIMPDKQIAAQLNRLGIPTAKGHTWTRIRVGNFRTQNYIANFQSDERQARGELTVEEAAEKLGVSYMKPVQIKSAVKSGW